MIPNGMCFSKKSTRSFNSAIKKIKRYRGCIFVEKGIHCVREYFFAAVACRSKPDDLALIFQPISAPKGCRNGNPFCSI